MERLLIAWASMVIKDRLLDESDGIDMGVVPNRYLHGTIQRGEPTSAQYTGMVRKFTRQHIYAFKLLLDEMKSLGVAMRLNWRTEDEPKYNTNPKGISSIRFGLMDPTEIRKMSAVEVKTVDTYKDDGRAYSQGLMDMHMGVIDNLVCPTDNCKYDESCHFGYSIRTSCNPHRVR